MRVRAFAALVLATAVTVSGCGVLDGVLGGGGGNGESTPTAAPTVRQTGLVIPKGGVFARADALASLSFTSTYGGPARLDVLAVQRVAPDVVVARYRLRGDGPSAFAYGDTDHVTYNHWDTSFNGIRLVDLAGRQLYVPMAREDEKCACSSFTYAFEVGRGVGSALWAAYAVPKEAKAVAISAKAVGITRQVPIAPADAPLPKVPGEPTATQLSQHSGESYPLSAATLGPDERIKGKGRTVTVELPADVLFEFGAATLTTDARQQLREAANRLRAEATGAVSITGHTDAIGSEQENLKLSRERAQTVADALRPMLRGSRLTLETSGKGEAEPVAPNRKNGEDNPEGRKLNRRVELSYQRVVQPPSQSATPKPAPAPTGTVGTVSGNEDYTEGVTLRLHEVRRMAGGTALVRFTAVNNSSQSIDLDQWGALAGDVGWLSTWVSNYHGGDAFWVQLRDQEKNAYLTLSDSTARCLCSPTPTLDSGETAKLYALTTAPPAGVKTVGVHFTGYGTIKDVPIRG